MSSRRMGDARNALWFCPIVSLSVPASGEPRFSDYNITRFRWHIMSFLSWFDGSIGIVNFLHIWKHDNAQEIKKKGGVNTRPNYREGWVTPEETSLSSSGVRETRTTHAIVCLENLTLIKWVKCLSSSFASDCAGEKSEEEKKKKRNRQRKGQFGSLQGVIARYVCWSSAYSFRNFQGKVQPLHLF